MRSAARPRTHTQAQARASQARVFFARLAACTHATTCSHASPRAVHALRPASPPRSPCREAHDHHCVQCRRVTGACTPAACVGGCVACKQCRAQQSGCAATLTGPSTRAHTGAPTRCDTHTHHHAPRTALLHGGQPVDLQRLHVLPKLVVIHRQHRDVTLPVIGRCVRACACCCAHVFVCCWATVPHRQRRRSRPPHAPSACATHTAQHTAHTAHTARTAQTAHAALTAAPAPHGPRPARAR
jgi:hypothetical protein